MCARANTERRGKRWRLQAAILLIGLVGLTLATIRTVDEADDQVLPGPGALTIAAVLTAGSVLASGHAWTALFGGVHDGRSGIVVFRGTYYVSQITKYLPAGGVAQAASQISLAPGAGVSLGRVALAFPVSAVGATAAGATLASGLVLFPELSTWVRALALCGLASPLLLRRNLMAAVLTLARRVVKRIPATDRLPTQRGIVLFYLWALVTIGALAGAYTVLVASLSDAAPPGLVFCAFAASWVIGFLAVPLPAGIGVREAVLVALVPGVGTAPLLAASLALRLISIGAELLAIGGNHLAIRWHRGREEAGASGTPAGTVLVPPIGDAPATTPGRSATTTEDTTGERGKANEV
jgi:uncharacterized membrane protein YbhN (UPF0104 family)